MHSRHQTADGDPQLLSPATQIIESSADYLGDAQSDLGRRVAPDKVELFTTGDAAAAVRDQLARQHSEFLAVHDVGAHGGLRLLGSLATALKTPLQQLAIRRQGQGVPLATVRFVEIPGRGKRVLRVYSTDIDADMRARQQIGALLVGHSRLGALLVGHLPAHALATQLKPLRDAIQSGPWTNRTLLLIPSSTNADLASHAAILSGASGPHVIVTANAASLNQAWSIVAGAWNEVREGRQPTATAPTARPPAASPATPAASPSPPAAPRTSPSTTGQPAAGADTSVWPKVGGAAPRAAGGALGLPATRQPASPEDPLWARYLTACGEIKGMISACLMDVHGSRSLGHVGSRPGPESLVEQGQAIFQAIARGGQALGLGSSQPDASIALTSHHLLLHPLPGHPGTVLHAVLDGSIADLTLARMHLRRIDATVLGAKTPT